MRAKLRRAVLFGMATTIGVVIWPAVSVASQQADRAAVTETAARVCDGPPARGMGKMMSMPGHDTGMGNGGHGAMMSAPGHDHTMQDRR